MKHKVKLIIAPYGAGSHFLGYIQSVILGEKRREEIFDRKRNLWDFEHVLGFDRRVPIDDSFDGERPLTEKQKILKQKMSNLDTLGEPVIRKFSQYATGPMELNFHIYPFGIEEYFDPEVTFFLTMNKDRFMWCYQLADWKHEETPRDDWKIDAEKEWENHVQIKRQLTDPNIIFEYEDFFTIQNRETINRFINLGRYADKRINVPMEVLCKMFADYNAYNEQILPW